MPDYYKNEEINEKIRLSLDENYINFVNKHQGFFKTDYPTNGYCKNISITLDGLIENKYQLTPRRLIDFKEGLAHLKLLLSISTNKGIKSFYKKLQDQKTFNPDNPNYNAITEILNQYCSNSGNKNNSNTQYEEGNLSLIPSLDRKENGVTGKNNNFPRHIERLPKINVEFIKSFKQMMTDNIKKYYEKLDETKEEYRYYKEKVSIILGLIKGKSKEKFDLEGEVVKINEEYNRIKSLKNLLSTRKNELRFLKKRMNLYATFFDNEQKEKTDNTTNKTTLLSTKVQKEKINYQQTMVRFKKQETDVQNILGTIQKFKNKKSEVLKKHAAISKKLSHLEYSLKEGIAYKDNLGKEIKSLSGRIQSQKPESEFLDKIITSHDRLESCLIKESENTKSSLEIQNLIFTRYKNNNNIRFNLNNKHAEAFSEINEEAERLYKQIDTFQDNNKKILRHTEKLSKQVIKDQKRCDQIRHEFSNEISPARATKLLKKVSKNTAKLTKLKFNFEKIEKDLNRARNEKKDKLISLKNQGENHDLLIGKGNIFIELCKERVFSNETLLTGVYDKLIGLEIELATTYEKFKISCVYNDELLKKFSNIHSDIERVQKDILLEMQNDRNFLEQEEKKLNSHIVEQHGIQKKYKEFCDEFKWPSLNKDDIEVLLYQNSDLEKKLTDACSQKPEKYKFDLIEDESSFYYENFRRQLGDSFDKVILESKQYSVIPRLKKVESPSLFKAGVIVFLLLTCFSYLLVYNSDIYDYTKKSGASNLFTGNPVNESIPEKPFPTEPLRSLKINTLQNNSLNTFTSSLLPKSNHINMANDDAAGIKKINAVWSNYTDIFDDLRFDDPTSALSLFEIMVNKQVFDLTLMDSIQLLYSIKKVLQSEEGPFFNRLFNDFIKLGFKKKEAALMLLSNNRLLNETYSENIQYIFKGKIIPIAFLEKLSMKDFEKIMVPYMIANYKTFAKYNRSSVPKDINTYARNLAQDIYVCAKKFRVPITSLITITHQESFFMNLLGDGGKSASPFQIYQPTKELILKRMRRDGFKMPATVTNLENHISLAAFMTAYHFNNLIKRHATSIVDPFTHKPTALIVNLKKSTKSYNGGKPYDKNVLLKQLKLERYLKDKMKKMPRVS